MADVVLASHAFGPPEACQAVQRVTVQPGALCSSSARAALCALRALGLPHLLPLYGVEEWCLPPPLDWHPSLWRLAVVDGRGQVALHSVDPRLLQQDGTPERLAHAGIRDIAAVRWRPKAKNSLAVAHGGGICLWSADAGPAPMLAAGIRGLAAPSAWRRTLLHHGGHKQAVTSLCWSPCGQFLAAGSPQDSAFAVWDIATRVCTRLRCGSLGARLLRWSPKGNFLLVAGFATRSFEIWETHSWTCQSWSTGEHALSDAAWSTDEKVALITLSGSLQIAVLHFVGGAPSLLAHLLPLELPGIEQSRCTSISSVAFDSDSGRLAVACTTAGGDGLPAEHAVCVFAVQSSPVFQARLLGRVLPPPDRLAAGASQVGVAFRPRAAGRAEQQVGPCALAVSWPNGAVSLAAV